MAYGKKVRPSTGSGRTGDRGMIYIDCRGSAVDAETRNDSWWAGTHPTVAGGIDIEQKFLYYI
ncbi:MAG TPA: hypothetical protein G4O15_04240 [Dehalococcoidia bacterium]|nr:hypothetical protein [Dehalococcoidia bacterium]